MTFSRIILYTSFPFSSPEGLSQNDNKRSFSPFVVYKISHGDMIDRARRQKDATRIKRTEGEGCALILVADAFNPQSA